MQLSSDQMYADLGYSPVANPYAGISHLRHRPCQTVGVVVGIIVRGAVECLDLFRQCSEVDSIAVALPFTVTFCPAIVAVTPSASLTGSLPIRDRLPHLASTALSLRAAYQDYKAIQIADMPHRLIAAGNINYESNKT